MTSERTTHILADIIDLIGGGTPKTSVPEYWDGDIPWLSVKDFNDDNRYVYTTEKSITQKGLDNSSTKLLNCDDIIISARGTVGELAMISLPMAFNQSCYGIHGKKNVVVQTYLYYLLKYSIRLLKSQTHGSVFDTITRDTFANIEVSLPPLEEQQAIAGMLATLDDKIETNRAINHHLEMMAQSIYTQTFRLQDNPTTPIGEIVDVRDGTHDSPKAVESGFPLVTSKHLLSYGVDLSTPNRISKVDFDKINERSKVDTHDILISMIGTIGLISLVIERDINFAIKNVGLFKTSQTKELVYFVLCLLRSPEIKNHIDMRLAGSTQKYISLGELRQLPIAVPTEAELQDFNDMVRPLFEEIALRTEESVRLAILRDTLLPRLMSGELSVNDMDDK